MKRIFLLSWFVGLLFLLAADTKTGSGNQGMAAELKARNEVRSLLEAEDYATLIAITKKWSELSPDIQKHIVLALLKNFQSEKKLKLGGSPRVLVSGLSDVKPKEGEKVVVLTQNVYSEGGRSAWAIEELLPYCGLPRHIWLAKSQEEKNQVQQRAYEAVIRAMDMPIGLFIDMAKLSEEKRAILAANEKTPEAMLARLAKDPSAKVRIAVAQNNSVTFGILSGLIRDPDPEVQSAGWKSVARPGAARVLPK